MNKAEVGKAHALSCVESYYAAFFSERFEIRKLYAESFVPFGEVFEKIAGGASYENYPLPRLQETAELLGLSRHEFDERLCFHEDCLHLVRVNQSFFENAKLFPWRSDHWIAVFSAENGVRYVNQYPLSEGTLSSEQLRKIYGGASLRFYRRDGFCSAEYERMCKAQFEKLDAYAPRRIEVRGAGTAFRNALAVLKVLRRRLAEWLVLELGRNEELSAAAENLNKNYERALAAVQLRLQRKEASNEFLQDIADKSTVAETEFAQTYGRKKR